MGRKKIKNGNKKQSISISITPDLLEYFRSLHINLSSLINNLLEDYKENGKKNM